MDGAIHGKIVAGQFAAGAVKPICNNRRNLTAATALILARVFGNSPDFWLNVRQGFRRLIMPVGSAIARAAGRSGHLVGGPGGDFQYTFDFTFFVAFGEVEGLAGEPVIVSLTLMAREVERVITETEGSLPAFPRPRPFWKSRDHARLMIFVAAVILVREDVQNHATRNVVYGPPPCIRTCRIWAAEPLNAGGCASMAMRIIMRILTGPSRSITDQGWGCHVAVTRSRLHKP